MKQVKRPLANVDERSLCGLLAWGPGPSPYIYSSVYATWLCFT